jgi:hypothetical protein
MVAPALCPRPLGTGTGVLSWYGQFVGRLLSIHMRHGALLVEAIFNPREILYYDQVAL